MKMYVKYFFIVLLLIFSFYYTKEISNLLIYQSDLMKEIQEKKFLKEVTYENAIIDNGYIIPGLNGVKVNELESYYKMLNNDKFFSIENFVFKEVIPEISLTRNKNLIIKKGNSNKKMVSLVLEYDKKLIAYADGVNIKINVLVDENNFDSQAIYEQINNSCNINKLDKLFERYKINNQVCYVNENNFDYCLSKNKYLVKSTYEVSGQNIYNLDINAGDIIYINTLSLDNFKYLIRKINFRNLNISFISDLISEKR